MPTELAEALALAHRILDRPSGDPDDDLAMLSRQLLRQTEAIERLQAEPRARVTWLEEMRQLLAEETPPKIPAYVNHLVLDAIAGFLKLTESHLNASRESECIEFTSEDSGTGEDQHYEIVVREIDERSNQ